MKKVLLCLMFVVSAFISVEAQGLLVGKTVAGDSVIIGTSSISVVVPVTSTTCRVYNEAFKGILLDMPIDSVESQIPSLWLKVTVGTTKGVFTSGAEVLLCKENIFSITKRGVLSIVRMKNTYFSFISSTPNNIIVIDVVDGF